MNEVRGVVGNEVGERETLCRSRLPSLGGAEGRRPQFPHLWWRESMQGGLEKPGRAVRGDAASGCPQPEAKCRVSLAFRNLPGSGF